MGFIYKIISPTDKIYVGQTRRLSQRKWMYRNLVKRYVKGKSIIMNSIWKYGWEAHRFEIIEECDNAMLNEREIWWIANMRTFWHDNPDGMNMSRGGENGGRPWMHDLERRKKQSESRRGENGTFYGRSHTEETKKLIAAFMSKRNKEMQITIPEWGAEKGREIIRRPVIAYNNQGNFIAEYSSLTEAAKKLDILRVNVSDSIKYGSWVSAKYLFRYKTDGYPLSIDIGKINVKQEKRIVLYLNREYKIIKEYPSAKEASLELGISKTTINRSALTNWLKPIMTGHIFIYKDLYEEAIVKWKTSGIKMARNERVKSKYHQLWYLGRKHKQQTTLQEVGEQSS
jgi:group I intron endonuclease